MLNHPLPCPFCGGKPNLLGKPGAFGISCTCDGKRFLQTYGKTELEVVDSWNERLPAQGWSAWHGDEMPVDAGTPVEVRLRYGKVTKARAGSGYATRWTHGGPQDGHEDIIAYRLDVAPAHQMPAHKSEAYAIAEAAFADYFARNYPGPDTTIFDPAWHAPKIFYAAFRALSAPPAGDPAE